MTQPDRHTDPDTGSQLDTQSVRQTVSGILSVTHKSESWKGDDGKKLDFVPLLATLPSPSFLFQTAGKVKV